MTTRSLAFGAGVLAIWLGALLLALVGCGDNGDGGAGTPPGNGGESPADARAEPDPFDDEGPRFGTAAQCGACHKAIYAEWVASYHGQAMSDPLFLEFTADVNKEECIRCHAPVPLRLSGFETLIARSERRDDAISCLTCHQAGKHVTGPFANLTGACNPIEDPDQRDPVKMCFGCHNQHDTGNEWLGGPYSPNAPEPRSKPEANCLDCHMPEVERPLVEGGPPRKGRRHTWFGGHNLPQLRKAAKLDVEVAPLDGGGHRFRVWVTNVGAGHAIPTDARHRSFDTYVRLWDADGNVILDPLSLKDQDRSHVGKYRKQYRNSGLKDTQIPPGERVSGLGEWPGYVDVPEARSGRGEAWLVYRLTPRDVLDKRSLALENEADIGFHQIAPVVLRVEFTYGP